MWSSPPSPVLFLLTLFRVWGPYPLKDSASNETHTVADVDFSSLTAVPVTVALFSLIPPVPRPVGIPLRLRI